MASSFVCVRASFPLSGQEVDRIVLLIYREHKNFAILIHFRHDLPLAQMVSHRVNHRTTVLRQFHQVVEAVEKMALVAQLVIETENFVVQVLTYLGNVPASVALPVQNDGTIFVDRQKLLFWPTLVKNANLDHLVHICRVLFEEEEGFTFESFVDDLVDRRLMV